MDPKLLINNEKEDNKTQSSKLSKRSKKSRKSSRLRREENGGDNNKNSITFRLVNRSTEDPLSENPDASLWVLDPQIENEHDYQHFMKFVTKTEGIDEALPYYFRENNDDMVSHRSLYVFFF